MSRRPPLVADAATRPSTVVTAAWLAIAAAAASLLLNGFGLVQELGRLPALETQVSGQRAPGPQTHPLVVVTFVLVAAVTVAYSALLVLAARRMRRGRPAARVATTALCAVSLLSIVGFGIGAVAGLIAAFAIVFAWLPASSDWFRTATRDVP